MWELKVKTYTHGAVGQKKLIVQCIKPRHRGDVQSKLILAMLLKADKSQ